MNITAIDGDDDSGSESGAFSFVHGILQEADVIEEGDGIAIQRGNESSTLGSSWKDLMLVTVVNVFGCIERKRIEIVKGSGHVMTPEMT